MTKTSEKVISLISNVLTKRSSLTFLVLHLEAPKKAMVKTEGNPIETLWRKEVRRAQRVPCLLELAALAFPYLEPLSVFLPFKKITEV